MKPLAFPILLLSLFLSRADGADAPWTDKQVLEPKQLAERLKAEAADKQPLLLHVGFQFLFKNGHIPGSKFVGPGKDEAGIAKLKAELEKVPREREIVIYCGCCPMTKCPNVIPAFKAAQAMGFKNLKLLNLPDNFDKNWGDKGYPVEAD